MERSGQELHRYVCTKCGQHYFLVVQLIPTDAPTPLLEVTHGYDKVSG